MIWYGIGRFLIEMLRTDALMVGSLKVAQLVSILLIIAGLVLVIRGALNNKEGANYNN